MVLLVCRQMLGDEHDAQDACQATFLVLAKKARSIKKPEALGSWLHGVALRVSAKAKTAAARRRTHERRGLHMVARPESEWPGTDPCPELHEEIDRLPERYRLPVVLCYLEGLTHDQAAQQAGLAAGNRREPPGPSPRPPETAARAPRRLAGCRTARRPLTCQSHQDNRFVRLDRSDGSIRDSVCRG